MEKQQLKSKLGQCPICGKTAEVIETKKEACSKALTPCDGNEYMACYTGDTLEQRFIRYRRTSTDQKPKDKLC